MTDLKKLNDPNFIIEVAVGPPLPELVPQDRSKGIAFAKVYDTKPRRFIIKKAFVSADDYRAWDATNGRLVYNAHHPGKDPYASFDPLGLTNQGDKYQKQYMGEWEFHCDVTGHNGYPSFEVRPKAISRHGVQYLRYPSSGEVTGQIVLCVGQMSRLKTQSVRHSLFIGKGDDDIPVYTAVSDMMERTIQILNDKEELVAFIQKSTQALILNLAFEQASGYETLLDVAPGVDLSTMLGIFFAMQQVGTHVVKDAFNNFVANPLQNAATDSAVEAAGPTGKTALDMYTKLSQSATKNATTAEKFRTFFK